MGVLCADVQVVIESTASPATDVSASGLIPRRRGPTTTPGRLGPVVQPRRWLLGCRRLVGRSLRGHDRRPCCGQPDPRRPGHRRVELDEVVAWGANNNVVMTVLFAPLNTIRPCSHAPYSRRRLAVGPRRIRHYAHHRVAHNVGPSAPHERHQRAVGGTRTASLVARLAPLISRSCSPMVGGPSG